MHRLKRFCKSILEDILPKDPVTFAAVIVCGVIVGIVVMVPVAGLAWFISEPGEPLIDEGSIQASIAIWVLFIALLSLAGYLKQKWKDSI